MRRTMLLLAAFCIALEQQPAPMTRTSRSISWLASVAMCAPDSPSRTVVQPTRAAMPLTWPPAIASTSGWTVPPSAPTTLSVVKPAMAVCFVGGTLTAPRFPKASTARARMASAISAALCGSNSSRSTGTPDGCSGMDGSNSG